MQRLRRGQSSARAATCGRRPRAHRPIREAVSTGCLSLDRSRCSPAAFCVVLLSRGHGLVRGGAGDSRHRNCKGGVHRPGADAAGGFARHRGGDRYGQPAADAVPAPPVSLHSMNFHHFRGPQIHSRRFPVAPVFTGLLRAFRTAVLSGSLALTAMSAASDGNKADVAIVNGKVEYRREHNLSRRTGGGIADERADGQRGVRGPQRRDTARPASTPTRTPVQFIARIPEYAANGVRAFTLICRAGCRVTKAP